MSLPIALIPAFAALALVVWTLLPSRVSVSERLLQRVLTPEPAGELNDDGGDGRLPAWAVRVIGRVPKPSGYEEGLAGRLQRAGWPLRPSELIAVRAGLAAGAFVVVTAVTARGWLGVPAAAGAWWAVGFVLDRRVDGRCKAFVAQLPDTLQLLSASLEAGYGLMQALDTVAREAPEPTGEEFRRSLAEIRLGMDTAAALGSLADRVSGAARRGGGGHQHGEDFRWVVMAMQIQREVGGNLAELLRTVADTLREREQLRRNVRSLSAEGRLSAVILGVLPFGLAGYIAVVNPEYVGTLTSTGVGRLMTITSLLLMGAGWIWLRRVVRIEV